MRSAVFGAPLLLTSEASHSYSIDKEDPGRPNSHKKLLGLDTEALLLQARRTLERCDVMRRKAVYGQGKTVGEVGGINKGIIR